MFGVEPLEVRGFDQDAGADRHEVAAVDAPLQGAAFGAGVIARADQRDGEDAFVHAPTMGWRASQLAAGRRSVENEPRLQAVEGECARKGRRR